MKETQHQCRCIFVFIQPIRFDGTIPQNQNPNFLWAACYRTVLLGFTFLIVLVVKIILFYKIETIVCLQRKKTNVFLFYNTLDIFLGKGGITPTFFVYFLFCIFTTVGYILCFVFESCRSRWVEEFIRI